MWRCRVQLSGRASVYDGKPPRLSHPNLSRTGHDIANVSAPAYPLRINPEVSRNIARRAGRSQSRKRKDAIADERESGKNVQSRC